jgi:hypothetical protein
MLIQPINVRSATIGRETRKSLLSLCREEQEVHFRQQLRKKDADETESMRTRTLRLSTHKKFAVIWTPRRTDVEGIKSGNGITLTVRIAKEGQG